ncbi:uncharacterized protein UV8b_02901 [Ustilaginoidea virens]|uniref:Pyruvate dehydrogenase protein x component n=2 Tax=Ustilaginoidea virens TaxID=1159556 RepID=A0A8E5HNT2_USTVR|nr:uncharacterized protein UV8b_02901 [Ustilaginoidea virens]QUC18660.1 hypothetical protein UV8b_02901 [Ustilaginoidea virens]
MASFAAAARRASARLATSRGASRGLSSSARCLAAQNFVMPALSPTMTEGNIASWKVKEGEGYSAGDVLLEIETDKATMDVEAQEDGLVMKIVAGDGAKSVQVGTRIAVLAEAGDDVKTLEMPADEQPLGAGPSSSAGPSGGPREAGGPGDGDGRGRGHGHGQGKPAAHAAQSAELHEQRYPLMPSVETLAHRNGLSRDDLARIKPTGPNGRLLKGDVLAHLGSISADRPAAVSSRFERLSRLDLSNIKLAQNKAPAAKAAQEKASAAAAPPPLRINLPISLAKVAEVQRSIHHTLGVSLPLSTFVSRAAQVANDNLPPANRAPTASQLFDQLLGLDEVKAARGSRGVYLPQVSAAGPRAQPGRAASRAASGEGTDIIAVLAGRPAKKRAREAGAGVPAVPGLSSGLNVFSLVVPKEEERRAHVFLERCKAILEEEPGRLVL